MSATKFAFETVRGEHKLEIVFNTEEDAKWVSIGDKTPVTGLASAVSAIKFNRYAMVEPGLVLKATINELREEIFMKNVGYLRGDRLEELHSQGLVGRTREIEPNSWYRLHWQGERFTTEDVVYQDYSEGEYEGQGGPKHNRRALKMLDGFGKLLKAQKKGVNIRLFWLPELDVYMNKILDNVELIDAGELETARFNYQTAATVSGVRGTLRRMEKKTDLNSLGDETIVMVIDGKELRPVNVVDLVGKTAIMIVGGNGVDIGVPVPYPYVFDLENAARLAATAKIQRGRFEVVV